MILIPLNEQKFPFNDFLIHKYIHVHVIILMGRSYQCNWIEIDMETFTNQIKNKRSNFTNKGYLNTILWQPDEYCKRKCFHLCLFLQ